jgi:hypothetical protein
MQKYPDPEDFETEYDPNRKDPPFMTLRRDGLVRRQKPFIMLPKQSSFLTCPFKLPPRFEFNKVGWKNPYDQF